jgi:uncharacterized protein HemX
MILTLCLERRSKMKRLFVSLFAAVLGLAIMAQATPQTQNTKEQEKPKTQQTQQQGEKKQEKKKTEKKVEQKAPETKKDQKAPETKKDQTK